MMLPYRITATKLVIAVVLALGTSVAWAAKATECTKIGICYCVNDELKTAINERVDRFRKVIAEQRKAGKVVGFLSVPLTSTGGGNFDINREVASRTKAAVEKRFGSDYVYVLEPGTTEADLPNGTGADYMLMWTTLFEGTDGLGEFDFVYFTGPQDFANYFGFDGTNDIAKLDAYYDKRVQSDPGFEKAVKAGLTKTMFRRYYAVRASVAVSRGSHDEWNIFRALNEKRRADPKLGTGNQIAMLFNGQPVMPPAGEAGVSDGYVGKCTP